jgi:hypothetical protein
MPEEKRKSGRSSRAEQKQFPPRQNLHAHQQNMGNHFANKHTDKCPKWNKKSNMYPRWFLKKYCFSNCKHKESRMKGDAIPAENLTPMKNWVKLCRLDTN